MPKYKILKTKYTTNDVTIPESIKNSIWIGKIDDNDTLDMFDFYSDAKYFADNLEKTKPERKYKIMEILGDVRITETKIVGIELSTEEENTLKQLAKRLG